MTRWQRLLHRLRIRRYVVGIDLAWPDGDYGAVTVVRRKRDGSIVLLSQTTNGARRA